MVSTVVHVSMGIIIACAILPSRSFGYKSLGIVAIIVAFLDADALLFFISDGLHRAVLHNLVFPTLVLLAIVYDVKFREESFFKQYVSAEWLIPVSITCYIAVIFAGIGLDYSNTGANLLWPLHDQFYTLDGKLVVSSEKGVIQTFIESPADVVASNPEETTSTKSFNTPVNSKSEDKGRVFHIAYQGWQMVVIFTSIATVSARSLSEKL